MRVVPIPIPNPHVDFGRLRSDFVVGTHNGCGAAASTMPYSATSLTGPAVEDETRRTCVTNGFPPLIPIQIWVECCIKLHLSTDRWTQMRKQPSVSFHEQRSLLYGSTDNGPTPILVQLFASPILQYNTYFVRIMVRSARSIFTGQNRGTITPLYLHCLDRQKEKTRHNVKKVSPCLCPVAPNFVRHWQKPPVKNGLAFQTNKKPYTLETGYIWKPDIRIIRL